MPTPIEILLDPVSLAVLAMYAILMIWEALFPARQLPKIRFWKLRGLTAFAFFFYLSSYLPLLTDPYLEPYRLMDLTNLGALGGGLVGILLYEFGVYVWHRALHTSDFLWRTFHQMHHSAERLDTYGAFYFSPMDMIGWTVLGSICFALIVGLSPQAITVTLLVTTFLGMFQHANIVTPRWLGYVIQRPESHTVHHAKGIHKHNYSDLPVFDILFGTFENPKNYKYQTGFYYGASAKVIDMLSFKDLNKLREKNKLKRSAKRQATKALIIVLVIGLTFGCSKDDGPTVDPIQKDEVGQLVPRIDSISPTESPRITEMRIYGSHFGNDKNRIKVLFEKVQVAPDFVTDSIVYVNVPVGAGTGNIKLRIQGQEIIGPVFTYDDSPWVDVWAGGDSLGSNDGLGIEAKFRYPHAIAIDSLDNIYVADAGNHRIRKISPEGRVSTLAGSSPGNLDGIGVGAQFNFPSGVAVDKFGNVYVADTNNNSIRKITPDGVVTTITGSKEGDMDGSLSLAKFNHPEGIAVDANGNILVVDVGNQKIKKITPIGAVVTIAGSVAGFEDGKGAEAQFNYPANIAINKVGIIYVSDMINHRIRIINSQGEVSTLAGTLKGSDDGVRFNASFNLPQGIAITKDGNLLVADSENHRIRSVSPEGVVTTFSGSSKGRVDGTISAARFSLPNGIVIDSNGIIYVLELESGRIRRISQE